MTYRLTLGCDPGITGAIAALADGQFIRFIDMPTMLKKTGRHEVNAAGLAIQLRELRSLYATADVQAALEQVGSMPGQGVASSFGFGVSYGILKGVLASLSIPVHDVSPARWKRHLGLIGEDKDLARTVAIQKFPVAAEYLTRKRDIGRADSLCIAYWAFKTEAV